MSELENGDDLSLDDEENLESVEAEEAEAEQEESEPEEESEPQEPSNEGPESASGDDDTDDKPVDSERFVKRINKKHREMMEAIERADKLEKRIQELEASRKAEVPPEVPDVDPYSDDYQEQLRRRDEALLAKARYEAKQEAQREQEAKAKAEAVRLEQERFNKVANDFFARGKKLGLTEEAISESAGALSAMGFPQDVARDLLEEEDGPLVIAHLAANPDIAEQFIGASGYRAAKLIDQHVRAAIKKTSAKPKVKPAPEPDEPVSVNVGVADSPLLKGATFE